MAWWGGEFATGVLFVALAIGILYILSGFDDLLVDLIAEYARLFPRELSTSELSHLQSLPRKRFAILVPAWKEANIIGRMLFGNIRSIEYDAFTFFVGAYPNDPDTIRAVEDLNDPRAQVCINHQSGPTSKGQMLNHVVHSILRYQIEHSIVFDAFLFHDAEDVVHPKSLQVVNHALTTADMVQIPVFSLNVGWRDWIAGTYVDEFAESHTKDLLVREWLGAAVPSAGVGTALTRELAQCLLDRQGGELLNSKALTEDYELGVRVHAMGFKTSFVSRFYLREDGQREHIATREFFPKSVSRSIRQKTRWNVGIALQGWANLGWCGGFWNRYFLFRDRKGLFMNPATVLGYLVAGAVLGFRADHFRLEQPLHWMLLVSFGLMTWRLIQRSRSVARVYPLPVALLSLARVPIANLVNAAACVSALWQQGRATWTQTQLRWEKTEHELPASFGQASEVRAG